MNSPVFEFRSREPRSQTLFRFTIDAVRHTEFPLRKIATRIAEAYMRRVAADERIVRFHAGTTTEEICRAEIQNTKIVQRFLDGEVKLPADLEEAWVEALPEPYREDCARELVRRHGFLAARPPHAKDEGSMAGIADLVREFGQTMEAVAPILADGRIDVADRPYLKRALKESADLMAALVSLQQQLANALPESEMSTT